MHQIWRIAIYSDLRRQERADFRERALSEAIASHEW
jgi:hypothetical protein